MAWIERGGARSLSLSLGSERGVGGEQVRRKEGEGGREGDGPVKPLVGMVDGLASSDALALADAPLGGRMGELKDPRAGDVVVRLSDDGEHLGRLGPAEAVGRAEEEAEPVGRKVPEGTAVGVLGARLRGRQDLLAPEGRASERAVGGGWGEKGGVSMGR